MLGGVAQKGATPEGASGLLSLINGSNLDTSVLDNVAGLFGTGNNALGSLMKLGTSTLVPALFGDKAGGLVNALAGAAGIKGSSATNLLAMAVPLIFTFLKKYISQNNLSAGSLSSLLKGQGEFLSQSLDSRLTGALGYANPAAMLSGLGGAAARHGEARRSSGCDHRRCRDHGHEIRPDALAALADRRGDPARVVEHVLGQAGAAACPGAEGHRPGTGPPHPAPVAAPMAAAAYPFKAYFDTGSATIGPVANATITAAAEAIKKDNARVALTGYTDKTGDVAKNEELAKSRALAVRDALKAAGVAEGSIEMRPPVFVEAGAGGADQEARRVEINKL